MGGPPVIDLDIVRARAAVRSNTVATPATPDTSATPGTGSDSATGSKVAAVAALADEVANGSITTADTTGSKVAAVAALSAGNAKPVNTDDRVTCLRCRHYRRDAHRCTNHRRAGLTTATVGPDLAQLPQRCPGFTGPPEGVT